MQDTTTLFSEQRPSESGLWSGAYKIPWNDPGFSARMLAEHLSQDHDLASRKQETIQAQIQWIQRFFPQTTSKKLLDIGCGPGLYINKLAESGYACTGIDFSPASVQYAREHAGDKTSIIEGDVRTAAFESGYDAAMMLFGELNVFSPDECANILHKAHDALNPGGRLIIEVHTFDTIKNLGMSPGSWSRACALQGGLFSADPYVCLVENHWYQEQATALQLFHILKADGETARTYRNTVKAWTNAEYIKLLKEAGFAKCELHIDWPTNSNDYILFSATR